MVGSLVAQVPKDGMLVDVAGVTRAAVELLGIPAIVRHYPVS